MVSALKIDWEFIHRIAQVSIQAEDKSYSKDYPSETLHFPLTFHYFFFYIQIIFKEQVSSMVVEMYDTFCLALVVYE